MRSKKIKENLPNKVSVRLSDRQISYLNICADSLGVKYSDVIRMMIDNNLAKSGVLAYENKKTN